MGRDGPLVLASKVHHARLGLGVVTVVGLLEESVELTKGISTVVPSSRVLNPTPFDLLPFSSFLAVLVRNEDSRRAGHPG